MEHQLCQIWFIKAILLVLHVSYCCERWQVSDFQSLYLWSSFTHIKCYLEEDASYCAQYWELSASILGKLPVFVVARYNFEWIMESTVYRLDDFAAGRITFYVGGFCLFCLILSNRSKQIHTVFLVFFFFPEIFIKTS